MRAPNALLRAHLASRSRQACYLYGKSCINIVFPPENLGGEGGCGCSQTPRAIWLWHNSQTWSSHWPCRFSIDHQSLPSSNLTFREGCDAGKGLQNKCHYLLHLDLQILPHSSMPTSCILFGVSLDLASIFQGMYVAQSRGD